eukprot:GHVU01038263.1.p1 GENE.GHVU01038263.1~~GHVU01038263.1.p1  ORF type:complete len:159 (-),score=5.46 GHVU01038263.1:248-724(-)
MTAGCSLEALNKFEFDVGVDSPDFKFSCAHFVAQQGGRCRIHGHNYALSLTLGGPVGPDGYVIDFGDLKKAVRRFCQEMNEYFLVPAKSKLLTIEESGTSVRMRTQAGEEVVIPRADCKVCQLFSQRAGSTAVGVFPRWRHLIAFLPSAHPVVAIMKF